MSILIKNVKIVTMDDDTGIIDDGYIYIKGDKIQGIGIGQIKEIEENTIVIDGRNHCAMPGLINCHTHAAMTLLRGYGEGLPLMRWLNEKIWPMEGKFTKRHIEIGTKLACIEMLRSGTTAFNDMYYFQDAVMKAAEEIGIRAVLGIPLIGDGWEEQLKDAVRLSDEIKNTSTRGIITTMFAPHSPYTLSKEALINVAAAAKEYHKGIHIHIAETEDEISILREKYNTTPCELLFETGVLDNRVVGAHCIHLSDSDIDLIKKYDVSPVYNPESNMKLASGVARVYEMHEAGINMCMGTDGASSNNNLNMFEEIRSGAMLQKLWYNDATKFESKTMLKFATTNAARALGYNNIGIIKEGYDADIIMLNINKANLVPVHDLFSNLVYSANGSEVDTVIIKGRIIMQDNEFTEVDEEKIIYEAKTICENLHSL